MPERQRSDAGSVNRLSASGRKRAKEGTLHLRLSGATNLRARVTGVGYYYPTISYPVILSSYHPILSPYHPSILLSYHPITLSSYYPITLPYHPILTSYHPIRSYPIFLSYCPIILPIVVPYHLIILSSYPALSYPRGPRLSNGAGAKGEGRWSVAATRSNRHQTVWPSGLRRWLQAPVRKGVGSN